MECWRRLTIWSISGVHLIGILDVVVRETWSGKSEVGP